MKADGFLSEREGLLREAKKKVGPPLVDPQRLRKVVFTSLFLLEPG